MIPYDTITSLWIHVISPSAHLSVGSWECVEPESLARGDSADLHAIDQTYKHETSTVTMKQVHPYKKKKNNKQKKRAYIYIYITY